MASYDSDDEDYLEEGYTETGVLLGYACKEPGDDTISHLGGRPEWLDNGNNASSSPSAALAKCKTCSSPMALLLQLNAELPDRFPAHERRLYVFACRRPQCARTRGSVRAIRGTRVSVEARKAAEELVEEEKERERAEREERERKKAEVARLGDALFGGSGFGGGGAANPFANPFGGGGSGGGTGAGGNPFSSKPAINSGGSDAGALTKTFAAALSLNSSPPTPPPTAKGTTTTTTTTTTPHEPWPAESSLPKAYPVLYLAESEYEVLEPESTALPANARLHPTEAEDPSSPTAGGAGEDKETFESSMDTAFQRFADRLAQNDGQCIRYEFGGSPLLCSRDDAVGKMLGGGERGRVPACERCGAARAFEVQLVPHAITELEADEVGFDGMEWETIIVGVCEKDCGGETEDGKAGYVEEWVGVQWEEEVNKK